jgi:hypothetical protein
VFHEHGDSNVAFTKDVDLKGNIVIATPVVSVEESKVLFCIDS